MVFLREQLLFIFIAFLSTCVGVYIAWDMNLTWNKFYSYLISEKAIFSILFNYAVIQLFFIIFSRKYTALFLSQLFVIFLNFINKKKQQYLFSNLIFNSYKHSSLYIQGLCRHVVKRRVRNSHNLEKECFRR